MSNKSYNKYAGGEAKARTGVNSIARKEHQRRLDISGEEQQEDFGQENAYVRQQQQQYMRTLGVNSDGLAFNLEPRLNHFP